jgi:hypothetical protein
MKKVRLSFAALIAMATMFVACSDDDKTTDEAVMSDLTVEQHKGNLETEGVAFVQKMDAAAELETFDVMQEFFTLMDSQEEVNPVVAVALDQINSVKEGPQVTVDLKSLEQEGVMKVSDEYKAQVGIYEWDAVLGDWTKVAEATDEITYKFTVDATDAEVSVYGFTYREAQHNDNPEMVVELPLTLNAHIKLGDNTLSTFVFNGQWYENDTPKLLTETLVVEDFKYEATLDLMNKSNLKTSTAFTLNGENIFAAGIDIDGNVDVDEIMNLFPEEGQEGDGMGTALEQQVINNANVWFQIGNVKLEGIVNVKGIIEDLKAKMESMGEESEVDFDAIMVEIMNKEGNAALYVKYAKENEIIAKSEFYIRSYMDEEWDYATGQYVQVQKEEFDMKMVFADESAIDGDFFDNGFGDIITELNKLIVKMNTNYDLTWDEISDSAEAVN